jgi:hypothetical protein
MRNSVAGEWLRARWERLGLSAAGISRSANISRSTLERVAAGGPHHPPNCCGPRRPAEAAPSRRSCPVPAWNHGCRARRPRPRRLPVIAVG